MNKEYLPTSGSDKVEQYTKSNCDADRSMDKFLKSVSPTISLISSDLCDQYIKKTSEYDDFFHFLKGEDVIQQVRKRMAKKNQTEEDEIVFNIKNISLITNKYNSFPVRYIKNINEQFESQKDINFKTYESVNLEKNDNSATDFNEFLGQLYSEDTDKRFVIGPFNTFNHPIIYLIALSIDDDINTINQLLVDNRLDRKKHLYNLNDGKDKKISAAGYSNSLIPNFINMENDDDSIICFQIISNENTDQDKIKELQTVIKKTFYYSCLKVDLADINSATIELIKSIMIPFMEKKISYWDDVYIQPRKSLTNRFFKFIKRQDDTSGSNGGSGGSKSKSNNVDGIFNHDSSEMILRRLADWSFILKDYKYSLQVYEILLKEINSHDNNNNKSKYYWNYLTSIQEYLMFSNLFLITNNEFNKKFPNMNIIIDQINYNYLFRCNLNSNYLRFIIEISEMINFKNSDFEKRKAMESKSKNNIGSNSNSNNNSAKNNFNLNYSINYNLQLLHDIKNLNYFFKYLIMERISYYYSNFGKQEPSLNHEVNKTDEQKKQDNSISDFKVFSSSEEQLFNPYKLNKNKNLSTIGIARTRKQNFYNLLSLNELKDIVSTKEEFIAAIDLKIDSLLEYYKNNPWLLRDNGLLKKNIAKMNHEDS